MDDGTESAPDHPSGRGRILRALGSVVVLLALGLLVAESSAAAGFAASSVSAGSFHSCAIKDGGAWCWGDNSSGQLGNGTNANSDVPVPVTGLGSGVTVVSAGYNHTCAIKDGGVWCWGGNYQGQLGNGTQNDSNVPVPATDLGSGMTTLSVGSRYSCAGNSLIARCWGLNSDWRAGNMIANNQRSLEPFPIGTPAAAGDLEALAAGIGNHTCAIVDAYPNGWCWGRNYDGQAGADPSKTDPHTGLSLQLIRDGQFINPIMGESDITAITVGLNHTCLILNGGVMCMGRNDMGQLGDGTGVGDFNPHWVSGLGAGSNVTSIIAGTSYGCALSTTQGMKCWGSNDYGQFGNGTGVGADVPVPVSGFPAPVTAISGFATRTCAIADGGVWCTSPDHPGQGPQPVPEAPRAMITGPADGTATTAGTVDVAFQSTGYPTPSCKANGVDESGPTATVPLSLGVNQIEVVCTSSAGSDTATISVTRYSPISVAITEPTAGDTTTDTSTNVSFKVNGQAVIPGDVACLVNGEATIYPTTNEVTLDLGVNSITVACSNAHVSDSADVNVTRYSSLTVGITSPADQFSTSAAEVNATYTVNGQGTIPGDSSCQVNGSSSTNPETNQVSLAAGQNQITVSCSNPVSSDSSQITVYRNQAPGISNIMPQGQPYATSNPDIELWFTRSGYPQPTCTVNGSPSNGHTYETLQIGHNLFTIRCENSFGGESHVATESVPMLLFAPPVLTVSTPTDGAMVTTDQVPVVFDVTGHDPPACRVNGIPRTSPTAVNLDLGQNTITIRCENTMGSDEKSVTITRYQTPQITVTAPADGRETPGSQVDVEFSATGLPDPECTVNGQPSTGQSTVDLDVGENRLAVRCENEFGGETHSETRSIRVVRTREPGVVIDSPADRDETSDPTAEVRFTTTGYPAPACEVNGIAAESPAAVDLLPGPNSITVRCENSSGSTEGSVEVTRVQAPQVSLESPADGLKTTSQRVDVEFTVTGYPEPDCRLNDAPATSPATADLVPGANSITVRCESTAGSDLRSVTVIREVEPEPEPVRRKPAVRNVRKAVRVGKPIRFTLRCDTRCRVGVGLKIGRKKVRRLRTVWAPAGSTRKVIRVPRRVIRQIRRTWRKARRTKVVLILRPVSAEGTGRTVRVRLKR